MKIKHWRPWSALRRSAWWQCWAQRLARIPLSPKGWWRWYQSRRIGKRLGDIDDPLRVEAQQAVDRVVWETSITPDCVSANTVNGGPAIFLKIDGSQEVFVHHTYDKAAEEAIAWLRLQGSEVTTKNTSKMNRKQRRTFDKMRRGRQAH